MTQLTQTDQTAPASPCHNPPEPNLPYRTRTYRTCQNMPQHTLPYRNKPRLPYRNPTDHNITERTPLCLACLTVTEPTVTRITLTRPACHTAPNHNSTQLNTPRLPKAVPGCHATYSAVTTVNRPKSPPFSGRHSQIPTPNPARLIRFTMSLGRIRSASYSMSIAHCQSSK